MPINFSQLVYDPCFNVFARPITVLPKASQPSVASYEARGIYSTMPLDIPAEDASIFSDQHTILYVRDAEFGGNPPIQGDIIDMPEAADVAGGLFIVIDTKQNSGGETTLNLRRMMVAKP